MALLPEIRRRRTIRRFAQTPIPPEKLRSLIEAARIAPCATNRQVLRYIVVTRQELLRRLFELTRYAGLVAPRRDPVWGESAPTAIIAVTFTGENTPLLHADAGAAIENLLLQAEAEGLGACWIGSFNPQAAEKLLNVPVLYMIAVGYPGETPELVDAEATDPLAYYLDDHDVLHVPKLTVDNLCQFLD